MPSKKIPSQFVFMNHKVISGDPKPVRPVMRPIVISGAVHKNPLNVKFK